MNRVAYKIITVILFLSCLFVGGWISTTLIADYFNYHPMLGQPLFHIGQIAVYWPWSCLKWMLSFQDRYSHGFESQTLPIFGGAILGVLSAIFVGRLAVKKGEDGLKTHGSSRWAKAREIEQAGLRAKDGVILGLTWDKKEYLRHNGPEHICVFAPTRSGKGVGLVVPTLLSWTGSVVCFDPKGENWRLTSGFRNKFSRCIYFDPSSLKSARFNPLSEVRLGPSEVKDAQNIADMLVDPDGSDRRQSHWERTAHALLVGAILHVLYVEKDKTLTGISNFLANPGRTTHETLNAMLTTKHLGDRVHPVVASSARELLNKASEELSGVVSTAVSFLSLYRDPIVAQATSVSDFMVRDLVCAKQPVSLFLVVPPSDLSRTKPLMRLILNQIGRILTESMDDKHQGHRLLLLLDEFPALGRLGFFESALAFIAGYGIKAFLITQSLNQIESIYGQNNSILDNCHVRIAFATNDERTAKRISDLVGSKTGIKEQESWSGGKGALLFSNRSLSFQEFARPLLTPSEVNQLPPEEQIIFVAGVAPILAKKMRYYEDAAFLERILPPVLIEEASDAPVLAKESLISNETSVESQAEYISEKKPSLNYSDPGMDKLNIRGASL